MNFKIFKLILLDIVKYVLPVLVLGVAGFFFFYFIYGLNPGGIWFWEEISSFWSESWIGGLIMVGMTSFVGTLMLALISAVLWFIGHHIYEYIEEKASEVERSERQNALIRVQRVRQPAAAEEEGSFEF